MRIWLFSIAMSMTLGIGSDVRAHPHIFVETQVEIVFDDKGRPDGIWISWTYDALFSMLLVSDLGLDAEFTGTLGPEERAALDGFDMNWIEGYHGDTHVTQDGRRLALSGPVKWDSDYRDGQLHSRHLRHLIDQPDLTREWSIAVYDPTYYTSYSLTDMPDITGRTDCDARVFEPDWDAAGQQLEAALDELLGGDGDVEADFPLVSALFSEEIRITCAAH